MSEKYVVEKLAVKQFCEATGRSINKSDRALKMIEAWEALYHRLNAIERRLDKLEGGKSQRE